jgi:hypothetical protein
MLGLATWLGTRWRRAQQRLVATELAWAGELPFPLEGYVDWLVADRPVLQVTLRAGLDPTVLRSALLVVDPHATLELIDPCRFRLRLPRSWAPPPPTDRRGITTAASPTTARANVVTLHALTTQLLLPLHRDVGIEVVRMGDVAPSAPPPAAPAPAVA